MSKRRATATLLACLFFPASAVADTWECRFPKTQYPVMYTVKGGNVIQQMQLSDVVWQASFQIVRNDPHGLVGVRIYSRSEGKTASIGTETIVIDKDRGNFALGQANELDSRADAIMPMPIRGKCSRH